MSQARMAEKKQSKVLWPLMGFILAVALLAIAAVLHETVLGILPARIRNLLVSLPVVSANLGIGVGDLVIIAFLFLIFSGIAFLIVSAVAPKPKADVKDSVMMKERNKMLAEQSAKERLSRKIAQENRRVLREEAKRKSGE